MQQTKVLFTDGEGPLVFKDLAQDLMGRITFESQGRKIQGADFFELLSLYDDYLAEVGTEGYQAGDTLALVVPHFLHHGITDEDVVEEVKKTEFCRGVEEYLNGLKCDGWAVRVISTAYRPLWKFAGDYLGIPQEHIACTELNLKNLREKHQGPQFDEMVEKMEQEILPMLHWVEEIKKETNEGKSVEEVFNNIKYAPLRGRLDEFYWQELRDLDYPVLEKVEVMGGRRKIEAAQRFAQELKVPIWQVVYVGDSITDDKMHEYLREEGGLPIAINGNEYANRNSRVAVATLDMRDLRPVVDAWDRGGIGGVRSFIEASSAGRLPAGKKRAPIPEKEWPRYFILEGAIPEEQKAALDTTKRSRKLVRGAAADLG